VWISTDVASGSTTLSPIVPMPRRLANIWVTVAPVLVTRIMVGIPGTRTVTGTPATGTTVAAIGTATRTDGTAGTGVNVAALLLPEVDATLPTGGAGATPEARQEAAAREGNTMRRRLLRWRPRTLVGNSRHRRRRRCRRSRGNKNGRARGQVTKRFPVSWHLKFPIFSFSTKSREELDPIR